MRRDLIDDVPLDGSHAVRLRLRPIRTARPVPDGDLQYFMDAVTTECQLWGGAATPLIPVTSQHHVDPLYVDLLRGADIDGVVGLDLDAFDPAEPGSLVEVPTDVEPWWGLQFAPATISNVHPDRKPAVECAKLAIDDPWRAIYAACLGTLPDAPDAAVLLRGQYREDLRFEELIDLKFHETEGDARDLLSRLGSLSARSPRRAAMYKLAYGKRPNSSLRSRSPSSTIPRGRYWANDAGPNVLVVCTPGDVRDVSLLWNLRAAHGDNHGLPVGVLVDSFTPELVAHLLESDLLARQGFAAHSLYVTSASIDATDLHRAWRSAPSHGGQPRQHRVAFIDARHVVDLGPAAGRHRQDVAMWADGRTSIVPMLPEDHSALSWPGARNIELRFDVDVVDSPFPTHPEVRTGQFTDFYAGTTTRNATGVHASPTVVEWPTRMLMLRVVAQRRDLTVDQSEAGVACMTLLEALDGTWELSYLTHGPLLDLFAEMAARTGTAWAKAFNRSGQPIASVVAPTVDDLPEASFQRFSKALGLKTRPSRAWMAWAERRRIVVKGFPLQCERCSARQWVPVSGYSPPIVCIGCARPMEHPFPTEQVAFTYRLGEVMRRIYEHDAMGHLLTLRYLSMLFHRGFEPSFVGFHPGLNFSRRGSSTRVGEADVLLLERDGGCIPAEVKKSFGGATADQLEKLSVLSEALAAPWDVVAVTEYAKDAPEGWVSSIRIRRTVTEEQQLVGSEAREQDSAGPADAVESHCATGERPRIVLTYDHLLEPAPMWTMESNPLEGDPMDQVAIAERESRFARTCESLMPDRPRSRLENDMLYEPSRDQ